MIVNQVTLAA